MSTRQYLYIKKVSYKLIAVDLSKQEALDADPEAVQKISFTRNPNDTNVNIIFTAEEAKETILYLSLKVL